MKLHLIVNSMVLIFEEMETHNHKYNHFYIANPAKLLYVEIKNIMRRDG